VSDALEVGTKNHRFVDPSEGEVFAFWISWDHGLWANLWANVFRVDDGVLVEMDSWDRGLWANRRENVCRVDDGVLVGMDSSKVIVLDPCPQVWGSNSCSCSY